MANRLALPRLYVILDAALLPSDPVEFVKRLMGAGARLFQYRNKTAPAREILQASQALNVTVRQEGGSFLVNDRPDIARLAGANGVHVGQDDLDVAGARVVVGSDGIVGISTHNLAQFEAAANTDADYIAVGPVFETLSKAKPDPVVGLELIRQARGLTRKPIVAIGGITLERAGDVIAAGADSVAVISDILAAKNPPARVKQYLDILPAAAQPAKN
ncbi:MAG TPA: thiamine phosphate synthase [Candidatus Acidoferrum sp.]|nr:thiamine phosphate synthase [Candidatus Acidoferrum sp.]